MKIYTKKRKLRWNRVGILIIAFALCLSFAITASGETLPSENQIASIIVEQGDNLWNLIKSVNPQFVGNMNEAIYETQKLNNIHNANLQVGQLINIPTNFD